MKITKLLLIMVLTQVVVLTSCAQKEESNSPKESPMVVKPTKKAKVKKPNTYGGWYCPDNLDGFPAVDLAEFHKIPVVVGRLPTREETRNGKSLIYIDIEKHPGAKPLNITLPKPARYYNKHSKKNEVIIVIQAIEVANDTVVGFRYLNGGNGSAWYSEVDFLSNEEISLLGATPFVSIDSDLNTTPEKIWEVITNPNNAKVLGQALGENTYMQSDWKKNSKVYILNESEKLTATGNITIGWQNTYIQIDYDFDGVHYVEKFFMMNNEETNTTQFRVVTGPYSTDFKHKKVGWSNWYAKVKELSEQP